MNPGLLAGNKVHFLSRQTISQPLQEDTAGPPNINLHGSNLPLPRGGEGEKGKCFHLNGRIYHTCFRQANGWPWEEGRRR